MEVLFFGKMADVAGCKSLTTAIADGETLHALRDRIFSDALATGRVTVRDIRMSVNKTIVTADHGVGDGDEVAFFSIFSGG